MGPPEQSLIRRQTATVNGFEVWLDEDQWQLQALAPTTSSLRNAPPLGQLEPISQDLPSLCSCPDSHLPPGLSLTLGFLHCPSQAAFACLYHKSHRALRRWLTSFSLPKRLAVCRQRLETCAISPVPVAVAVRRSRTGADSTL